MSQTQSQRRGWLDRWNGLPLYLRIVVAVLAAIPTGLLLGERALFFEIPARIILQLLGALAPPLILVAVVQVLLTTELRGRTVPRLAALLFTNTLVAILIGLLVANVARPGTWSDLETPSTPNEQGSGSLVELIVENVPKSVLGPLGDRQNIIGVIIIAIAVGLALRKLRDKPITSVQDLVELVYGALLVILHWLIALVPLGVFAVVTKVIGVEGFAPLLALGAFVLSVLAALALQLGWYLVRIRLASPFRPLAVLRGMRDALFMAFSTDSSTATMPVTYACLKDEVGVREEAASLGALVGANFNNDGTALYEAMSALFVAQLVGLDLSFSDQLVVVVTAIVASVGAAGIPEAGLVTMTLVFAAVGLPTEYIALLLTVDWFLDRCRTTINVMGDVNVACLLDAGSRSKADPNMH